jgi:hypothetical protein
MKTINTRPTSFATKLQYSVTALILMAACPGPAGAQDAHSHTPPAQQQQSALDDANALVKAVRQSTEQFKNVAAAQAAGYALQFGCVSGEDSGAMGLHYINADLVNSGVLDPARPQIVIYEPTPDGGRRLIGADFLVIADTWNASHSAPPQMMGQLFHLFPSPNRFGLPAFYTLHVWAWKENPTGAFVNWHSNVSCRSYTAQ